MLDWYGWVVQFATRRSFYALSEDPRMRLRVIMWWLERSQIIGLGVFVSIFINSFLIFFFNGFYQASSWLDERSFFVSCNQN